MNNNTLKQRNIKRLVLIGALGGISVFLGVTGLGIIRTPLFSLTIMHIPVIIGAIIEGPIVGASVGLIFGLFSMYQNFTAPGITSFIFWNPIIAIVPRVLIGVVSYYTFNFFNNFFKSKTLPISISSILATLTNTVGVLGLTYLIYLEKYATALDISTDTVAKTLLVVGFTNGIPEVLASVLITVPIVSTLLKLKKI